EVGGSRRPPCTPSSGASRHLLPAGEGKSSTPVDPLSRPLESDSQLVLRKDSVFRRAFSAPEFGPFVLLVVELAVFTAINPEFLSVLNISNTLTFTVELGLIALAMTLLM